MRVSGDEWRKVGEKMRRSTVMATAKTQMKKTTRTTRLKDEACIMRRATRRR